MWRWWDTVWPFGKWTVPLSLTFDSHFVGSCLIAWMNTALQYCWRLRCCQALHFKTGWWECAQLRWMTRHCSNHPPTLTHIHTPQLQAHARFEGAHHFTITKTKPWRFLSLSLHMQHAKKKCLQALAFIRHKDLRTTNSLVQKKGATLPCFLFQVIQITPVCWAKGCVAATLIWDHIRRFLCPRHC